MTPIFKKGSKGSPGNYRPVSLTSIPCKMFTCLLEGVVASAPVGVVEGKFGA